MFDVRLRNEPVHAQKKSDGYFVFTDLEPSATTYPVGVTATGYQSRGFDRQRADSQCRGGVLRGGR